MVVTLTSDALRTIRPYQLLEPLGGSGLFLCRAPSGERVAVRVIRADVAADPGFRAEVAAARRVAGAFTVPVVAADLDADVPWLATAYVAGPTLAEAVRDHGPVPAATVRALAAGLAEGLRAIHDAGLVHRDLNPSNVLLAGDGPRVTGFGSGSRSGRRARISGRPGSCRRSRPWGMTSDRRATSSAWVRCWFTRLLDKGRSGPGRVRCSCTGW